jgi:DNA-binding LacI/PurR family transcriptional regulator
MQLELLGRTAGELLLAAVNGSSANGVHIVPSKLVVRGSTPPVAVDGIPQTTAR